MRRILERWLRRFDGGVVTEATSALPMREPHSKVTDLSDNWELTFALLDATRRWKERGIHEFVLRDSDHVSAASAYQVRLPLDLVRRFVPTVNSGDPVRVLLPFAVRPKQLLLNVDFTGPQGTSIALIQRKVGARFQAEYIAHADGRSIDMQPEGGGLWVGVCEYTPSQWRESLENTRGSVFSRF